MAMKLIVRIGLLLFFLVFSPSEMARVNALENISIESLHEKSNAILNQIKSNDNNFYFPSSQIYYVRPDGGTPEQCTGLSNTEYGITGDLQDCAWDHPFRALPPQRSPRINNGDTLIIAKGSYMMGYGAPETAGVCEQNAAFDCFMSPVPSGIDYLHPTRILGEGWDFGCDDPPELWGTQRAHILFNLTNSSYVDVACLEITDHSTCVEFHTGGLACERDSYPFGEWASIGLYAEDSDRVRLSDLNIHGLASNGVQAGRLSNWIVNDVRIAGNGWAGWDGDLIGPDSNSGDLYFSKWVVEWNGCGESYPEQIPIGCWAQTAGGYGDGVGTGATAGNWIIEDSAFLYNTSDGLDLLYHTLGGSITLNRVHAEGNAGNQIKLTGDSEIVNSLLVGNCAFFEEKPFTYHVDSCRALGNTLEVVFTGGEQMILQNSTLYGQGDGLLNAGPREGFICNGGETIVGNNNVFYGNQDFFNPSDISFLFYQEGCGDLIFQADYNLAYHVKNTGSSFIVPPFPSTNNLLQDPRLSGLLHTNQYSMMPLPGSPVIDRGLNTKCPPLDVLRSARPVDGDRDGISICDLGAYEYPVVNRLYLPLVLLKND